METNIKTGQDKINPRITTAVCPIEQKSWNQCCNTEFNFFGCMSVATGDNAKATECGVNVMHEWQQMKFWETDTT